MIDNTEKPAYLLR